MLLVKMSVNYQTTDNRQQTTTKTDTETTTNSTLSASAQQNLARELFEDMGDGIVKSSGALASAPLDLSLAIAQGFHNAPRLYGDASVRKPVRITGMHSAVKAARRELLYGIYDGWSGIVTQPLHGWQDAKTKHGKLTGLGMGFARGIGGFVLKDISAVIAPPVFLVQGARKEVNKQLGGPGTSTFIRKAHIIQGSSIPHTLLRRGFWVESTRTINCVSRTSLLERRTSPKVDQD